MERIDMERIERIREMERCLDISKKAVDGLSAAFEEYMKAVDLLKQLTDYYEGQLWRSDLEYDEKGKLPPDLKRGVLSEDAVFDLLTDEKELKDRIIEKGGLMDHCMI